VEKLLEAQRQTRSYLALRLDLAANKAPLPLARTDDPLLPFAQALIDATRDVVCGYVLDPAYFLADGAAGVIALERIAAYVPADRVTVFDARFGHLGASAPAYARATREAFRADAVTFSVKADREVEEAFGRYAALQVFYPSEVGGELIDPRAGLIVATGWAEAMPLTPAPLLIRHAAASVKTASDQVKLIEGDPDLIYASRRADYLDATRAAVTAVSESLGRPA